MMYVLVFQKLCQMETRRLTFVMGILAISVLALQTLTLPYRNNLISLFPDGKIWLHGNTRLVSGESVLVGNISFLNGSILKKPAESNSEINGRKRHLKNDNGYENNSGAALQADKKMETIFLKETVELAQTDLSMEKERETEVGLSGEDYEIETVVLTENVEAPITDSTVEKRRETEIGSSEIVSELETIFLTENVEALKTISSVEKSREMEEEGFSIMDKEMDVIVSKSEDPVVPHSNSTTSTNFSILGTPVIKKFRCNMPPKTVMTISEMNRLLLRRRGSYHSVKTQWPWVRDQEILSAKSQIQNAPIVRNERELFAPLFRNCSVFKRSYELMEQTLKVYVYKEGDKPIFHKAEMKGIYASEGWFIKLMEGNPKFVVRNPKKAHLFYMPFSTRMLEYSLYVRNSHNRTNLAQYLKNYTHIISAKYPFWNRTSGADHFFVACHDWAPYETRHHMERCIKSLCNADVTAGFKIGKDVSLPETYVRSVRNPVKDIGGKPPSERPILAFFAGSIHGYLRPILLSYWENKDPEMKIIGPMPPGVASKMTYIQHMKSSKYCICAKGYNVNSPRVVESIFYECVPVIISDNFVPPFFEVLNWEAFSVIVAEKDIPILKDILLSIPYDKYLSLQIGVKKVQRHFIWHSKPIKYDLFHMILHSVWYNRVSMIRPK